MNPPNLTLPSPLRGAESGSFAHDTVTVRMPELVRLALAENDFPPEVVARLEALLAEMPASPIRPLIDPGAPDVQDWSGYVQRYAGQNWLQIPWFFAETYFYRRILEATGYFQPGPTHGLDPYARQKNLVWKVSKPVIRALCAQLNAMLHPRTPASFSSAEWKKADLQRLLVQNLWGNQADLSMWPAGKGERPDHQDVSAQQSHLLADDSLAMMAYLAGLDHPARVDFIMDNAGLELVDDLVLADYLLSSRLAATVRFHLKVHPTFISDALIEDVHHTVTLLADDSDPAVQALAKRLTVHLEAGRLLLTNHPFWTSPLSFWEMPEGLRAELATADLLISKGDANYRRLLGDRHWSPILPAAEVLDYVPAPLLAIRVLKAEIVIGLRPEQVEWLDQEDPKWNFDGQWGVIQFVNPDWDSPCA